MNAPAPRRPHALRVFAALAFAALVVLGPLTENTGSEKLFALSVVLATLLLLLFASARIAFALMSVSLLFGAIELAGVLKFKYLTTPLLAPDLEYFVNSGTLEVFSHYPLLLAVGLATLVLVPLLLVITFRCERAALLPARPRAVRALVRVAGAALAAWGLTLMLSADGPFAGVFNKPMWITVNDKSFITDFLTSFNDTVINEPVIPPDVDRSMSWKLDRPLQAPAQAPDVVLVLEESTFDPRILKLCTIAQCRLPMFDADKQTRAHGLLTVHTFGGGTWTSEFSALTGLAHTLFGNAGLYAPYNLAPRVSYTLPKAFQHAGYRAIALYPMSGDFLNARNAYDYYGFDAFYDGTEYGLGWDSHDADLFKVFERVYGDEKRAHPDTPLFVFMLTLHQHGPHMKPLAELPAPFDQPLFPGRFKPRALDDWLNLNLGNYLQRLEESNAMLDQLQKLLFDGKRPAVLAHFGDHQPSFDGAINEIPKQVPKAAGPVASWVTYYMIRANYPVRARYDYPVLDIAFLGSLVLDVAGVPKDAFYQANTLLRERCKGRYLDCKDKRTVASYHAWIFSTLGDLHENP
ncbi:MAG: LTA synthase family protein [Dokdonella sp.]|uniref:LTA synthase family protein n=2 Tax=Dokdonella sp. TaxID=2291710 RepID=UPI0025C03496|nr:LTA synthase family protein [Dokdonella sp.]MBX3699505.1 LTA synthase family protein [Dokdonella sp.]MCW5577805.1 LTA synthase family protein [Dokdonella sp.]